MRNARTSNNTNFCIGEVWSVLREQKLLAVPVKPDCPTGCDLCVPEVRNEAV